MNRFVWQSQNNASPNRSYKNHLRTLNLDDDVSVTAKAMLKGEFITGEIGIEPFGDSWLTKEHRGALRENGIRFVAIIPVRDSKKKPIASFTLLSRFAPFSGDWKPQFEFCARTVSTALSDFLIIRRVLNDGLSETTHEILNISTRLNDAVEKLSHSSKYNNEDDSEPLSQIHLDDIKGFTKTLGIVAEIMTPTAFIEAYSKASFLGSPMVHHFVKNFNRTPVKIKKILNKELENMRAELSKKKLRHKVNWKCKDRELLLDKYCTEISIRNVLGNAVKYAPRSSNIEIDYEQEYGRRNFVLRISSYGPRMSKQELHRIFERRFQSELVKTLNLPGRGEGLYQTQALMSAQRAVVSHDQFLDKTFEDCVWQVFRLKYEYTVEDERSWSKNVY